MNSASLANRKLSKYRDCCCVKGCDSKAHKSASVSFHRFPKPNKYFVDRENHFGVKEKIDVLKVWQVNLKKNHTPPRITVCSLHFTKEDYVLPDAAAKRRVLRKNAIPTCNLPKANDKEKNLKADQARLDRRMKRAVRSDTVVDAQKIKKYGVTKHAGFNKDVSTEKDQSQFLEESLPTEFINVVLKVNAETQTDISIFTQKTSEPVIKEFKDSKVQVNTLNQKIPNFVHSIQSDAQLSTATGIESFEILHTIVKMIKHVYGDKYERSNLKANTTERVIMVFTKLKQNLLYSLLAIMFNTYTAKHFQRVFEETIKVLSSVMKSVIPWPSKDEILSNLPKCFKGFEDTRVVLDCTEVYIQQPKEICCQVATYSHYKSHVTAKIMTGVSPSGTITFLSRVYGGRVSDSTIFEQSDLFKLLEPGDAIMVDRGFLVDKHCEINRWKCIRPPFLKNKRQFSKEESHLISKIASARVHIERSNQRIKTFKIVGSVLPGNLLVLLEEIFTVICGTINMSSPILKDDKFMDN